MDLRGNEYAQVKERLKTFRSDCPNALIETTPTISETHIIFKARILKDKSDPSSAEATGHSYGEVSKNKEKVFEKQETIAVGRALALLGYAGDGEIASSEEMEEFLEYQEEQKREALESYRERLESVTSLEELKSVWATIPAEGGFQVELATLKNELKAKYEKTANGAGKRGVATVEEGQD